MPQTFEENLILVVGLLTVLALIFAVGAFACDWLERHYPLD